MSVKKFRFVSPGVFINEIDRSQLERQPARMGPVIMGRTERGPGFRPTTVHSFAEFVEVFGNPIPGGETDDVWRNGNYNGPTYGAYAAQAYLKNNNPVTFVRLLGAHHDSNTGWSNTTTGLHGTAGWRTKNLPGSLGGAYGLFVAPSGSVGTRATAANALDTTSMGGDTKITITIPPDAGGESTGTIIFFDADVATNGDPVEGENMIAIAIDSSSDAAIAARLINAINGTTDGSVDFADSGVGQAGVQGVTAAEGDSNTQVTLTIDQRGSAGNAATIASTVDGSHPIVNVTTFTGGEKDEQVEASGSLAAVWYINDGYMQLTGTLYGTHTGSNHVTVSGSSTVIGSVGNLEWRALIKDSSHSTVVNTAFSFDPDAENYIRKVFNTNPQLVNTDIYDTGTTNYWLGQSFDRSVQDTIPAASSSANQAFGVMVQLSDGTNDYADQTKEHVPSETGWIISQDLSTNSTGYDAFDQQRAKRLFKFVSLDAGSEWNQNNIKISLEDIRPSKNDKTWPTFTVTIRAIDDSDKSQKILEKYTNCNLNAASPNYVARKIGDKQVTYDKTNKQLKVGGNYNNNSRYVRVKTNEGVYSRELLPFGCYGPPRYKGFTFHSGSAGSISAADDNTLIKAGSDMDHVATGSRNQTTLNHLGHSAMLEAGEFWSGPAGQNASLTASMKFAALPLRKKATDGGIVDQSKCFWGVDVTKTGSSETRYNTGVPDYLKSLPNQTSADNVDFHLTANNAECQFLFTLDDLTENHNNVITYISGSRQRSDGQGTTTAQSITHKSGSAFLLTASSMGHDKFTTVLYGGFDGWDIREKEPLNNTRALSVSGEKDSYAYFSLTKAIEIVKDPERVECNLLAMPGIINQDLTTRLVRIAEERADAMAVIDIENDYTPTGENTSTDMANQGNVDTAVRVMKDRKIDSSYGAAYYPWVQIQDTRTNQILWAPPSVVALGAMAYSDTIKDVWFAPAGFNRGGLTATGAGGVPVVGVNQQLTSKQRDKLYEVNVNPIASFPAEGIVVFGQKTLQLTPSALDRINVRRLLIFLKKEISRIASTTLFEPNVEVTWAAFRSQADALLSSVKSRLGLADYKLVLDETTTTADLIDRNIMYAKVYLKPARAIEFIALDFIITRSGASFED